ncbi:Ribosomal protein L39 [Spironucleus salmonicida]|uniref:Ribosomal protein L39 n=1 Tax=Spironucleus salmonicida TaxID=348837 RepID=V6LBB1_9EUKA|nr:Ribosomal protein L39 [Spironucleus salmonicida]|eukprot:EST41538.1 Ribosomal protein L39 [Spironucleus salmonicida]
MSGNNTFARKMKIATKIKQNKRIPRWIHLKADASKTRWNAGRHYWRRSHLKI